VASLHSNKHKHNSPSILVKSLSVSIFLSFGIEFDLSAVSSLTLQYHQSVAVNLLHHASLDWNAASSGRILHFIHLVPLSSSGLRGKHHCGYCHDRPPLAYETVHHESVESERLSNPLRNERCHSFALSRHTLNLFIWTGRRSLVTSCGMLPPLAYVHSYQITFILWL